MGRSAPCTVTSRGEVNDCASTGPSASVRNSRANGAGASRGGSLGRSARSVRRRQYRLQVPWPREARLVSRRQLGPQSQRSRDDHAQRAGDAGCALISCGSLDSGPDSRFGVLTIRMAANRLPEVDPSPGTTTNMRGSAVKRPRAADDFATIRARLEELRREREEAHATESELHQDPATNRSRSVRFGLAEVGSGPGRVRQSGPIRG